MIQFVLSFTGHVTYKIHSRPQLFKRWIYAYYWINPYPKDFAIGFPYTYPMDGDLSVGYHYPPFEQPRPGIKREIGILAGSKSIFPLF